MLQKEAILQAHTFHHFPMHSIPQMQLVVQQSRNIDQFLKQHQTYQRINTYLIPLADMATCTRLIIFGMDVKKFLALPWLQQRKECQVYYEEAKDPFFAILRLNSAHRPTAVMRQTEGFAHLKVFGSRFPSRMENIINVPKQLRFLNEDRNSTGVTTPTAAATTPPASAESSGKKRKQKKAAVVKLQQQQQQQSQQQQKQQQQQIQSQQQQHQFQQQQQHQQQFLLQQQFQQQQQQQNSHNHHKKQLQKQFHLQSQRPVNPLHPDTWPVNHEDDIYLSHLDEHDLGQQLINPAALILQPPHDFGDFRNVYVEHETIQKLQVFRPPVGALPAPTPALQLPPQAHAQLQQVGVMQAALAVPHDETRLKQETIDQHIDEILQKYMDCCMKLSKLRTHSAADSEELRRQQQSLEQCALMQTRKIQQLRSKKFDDGRNTTIVQTQVLVRNGLKQ